MTQQRLESSTVTVTRHASKYKVHKLHQLVFTHIRVCGQDRGADISFSLTAVSVLTVRLFHWVDGAPPPPPPPPRHTPTPNWKGLCIRTETALTFVVNWTITLRVVRQFLRHAGITMFRVAVLKSLGHFEFNPQSVGSQYGRGVKKKKKKQKRKKFTGRDCRGQPSDCLRRRTWEGQSRSGPIHWSRGLWPGRPAAVAGDWAGLA